MQGVEHEDELHDDVYGEADGRDKVQNHEEADGLGGTEAGPALERSQRDEERDDEEGEGDAAQEPDGERGAVLIQLEPDETVDEQAHTQCRREASLHSYKVGIWIRSWRDDAGVDTQRYEGQEHVDVEKRRDFLATYL